METVRIFINCGCAKKPMHRQAIQLYKMENGSVPTNLEALQTEYIAGNSEFKDAKGEALVYTASDTTYTLTGKNAAGEVITSGGSKASE